MSSQWLIQNKQHKTAHTCPIICIVADAVLCCTQRKEKLSCCGTNIIELRGISLNPHHIYMLYTKSCKIIVHRYNDDDDGWYTHFSLTYKKHVFQKILPLHPFLLCSKSGKTFNSWFDWNARKDLSYIQLYLQDEAFVSTIYAEYICTKWKTKHKLFRALYRGFVRYEYAQWTAGTCYICCIIIKCVVIIFREK